MANEPRRCVACGRMEPRGGLILNEEYEWLCKRHLACAMEIARQLREAK